MKLSSNMSKNKTESTDVNQDQRRLPLPKKLSIEQNLSNLIEKESPLLQSELLTAEHELSVLRSRLAVNEGVTAITGTILESLKEQFDRPKKNLREKFPSNLEIFYDRNSTEEKKKIFLLKTVDNCWIARPVDFHQVEEEFRKFSSAKLRKAKIISDETSSSSSDDENDRNHFLSELRSTFEFFKDQNLTKQFFDELRTLIREKKLDENQFEIFSEKILRTNDENERKRIFEDFLRSIREKIRCSRLNTDKNSTNSNSIVHLREIMSDLLLAASWTQKPKKIELDPTEEEQQIIAESFLTTEQKDQEKSFCQIFHEIEQIPMRKFSIKIDRCSELNDEIFHKKSKQIVDEVLEKAKNEIFHEKSVEIVNEIIEQAFSHYDDESKFEKDFDDFVQELEQVEKTFQRCSSFSSSSSSEDEEENRNFLPLEQEEQEKNGSLRDLSNLVAELEQIEEQIEERFDHENCSISQSKSVNELGGLIKEFCQVTKNVQNRIQEQIFTEANIEAFSQDFSVYRRQSLSQNPNSEEILSRKISRGFIDENFQSLSEKKNSSNSERNRNETNDDLFKQNFSNDHRRSLSRNFPSSRTRQNFTRTNTEPISQCFTNYRRQSLSRNLNQPNDEQNFTEENIEAFSKDLSHFRRQSSSQNQDDSNKEQIFVEKFIQQVIQQAQKFLHNERNSTNSLPKIVVDPVHRTFSHSSSLSISDDTDRLDDSNPVEKRDQLVAQLDYLRRMSRYDQNLIEQKRTTLEDSTDSLKDFTNRNVQNENFTNNFINTTHCQSAYDFHVDEKNKLVRSPEFYNIERAIDLNKNSTIQYRTLSESALTIDEFKRISNNSTSQETSDEFLTIISKETSSESMQQRHSTPYEDVLEKESSPEHSESSLIPSSAFSDALEPSSSCRRPLALHATSEQNKIDDSHLEIVANRLVNRVLDEIVREMNSERDDSSIISSHEDLLRTTSRSSSSCSSSSDDRIIEVDEDEEQQCLIDDSRKNFEDRPRLSLQKFLRRAQTDTEQFNIESSPILGDFRKIRRNSQSAGEVFFRDVSSTIDEYLTDEFEENIEKNCSTRLDSLSMVNCLQEKILQQNLESSNIENQTNSIIDRTTMENEVQILIDEILDSINDDLTVSLSSEPLSSHSDAPTVIFLSKIRSSNDEINSIENCFPNNFNIRSNSSSCSSSSSRSVIEVSSHQVDTSSSVNKNENQSYSMPSLMARKNSIDDQNKNKRNFHSYPGSFGDF